MNCYCFLRGKLHSFLLWTRTLVGGGLCSSDPLFAGSCEDQSGLLSLCLLLLSHLCLCRIMTARLDGQDIGTQITNKVTCIQGRAPPDRYSRLVYNGYRWTGDRFGRGMDRDSGACLNTPAGNARNFRYQTQYTIPYMYIHTDTPKYIYKYSIYNCIIYLELLIPVPEYA